MTTANDSATMTALLAECAELRRHNTRLQHDNHKLSDELAALIKRFFGRSSERLDPAQLALFADALASHEAAAEAPAPTSRPRKPRAKVNGRPHFPEHLPRDVIAMINTTPASQVATLTPWAWAAEQAMTQG